MKLNYQLLFPFLLSALFAIPLTAQNTTPQPWSKMHIDNYTKSSGSDTKYNYGELDAPGSANSSQVNISGSAKVDFKSSTIVKLHPGFKASNFSSTGYFHAHITQPDFQVAVFDPAPANYTSSGLLEVGQNEKLEIGLKLPADIRQKITSYVNDVKNNNITPPAVSTSGLNPYDPDQINVYAVFKTNIYVPLSGSHSITRNINGFYYQEYKPDPNQANDSWIQVNTDYNWRIRFAPPIKATPGLADGIWTCTIYVKIPSLNETLSVSDLQFKCVDGDPKGYLKVGLHGHQLAFQNGQSFFAIGQNIAWPYDNNQYSTTNPYKFNLSEFSDYNGWVKNLGQNKGNFFRMFLAPWGHEIEWEHLNFYRQINAWELDRVLDIAKNNNMYILLDLMLQDEYTNANGVFHWADNPYHKYLGLASQTDFFTNSTAKDIYKKRLRYVVARWGYSTHIAAWEVASEENHYWHDAASGDVNRQDVDNWVYEMKAELQSLDNSKHLVTTSYAEASDGSLLNTSDELDIQSNFVLMDLTSTHNYGGLRTQNYSQRFPKVKDFRQTFPGKPFIFGELGSGGGGIVDQCNDVEFHNAMWATAFMGCYGTGLNWSDVWSFDNYRAENMPAIANFFGSEDFEENFFTPYRECNKPLHPEKAQVETYYDVNLNKTHAIGWVHNLTDYWLNDWESPLHMEHEAPNYLNYHYDPPTPCPDDFWDGVNKPTIKGNVEPGIDYTSLPGDIFYVEHLKVTTIFSKKKYRVRWYLTKGTQNFLVYTQNGMITDGEGKLLLIVPSIPDVEDLAYKIDYTGNNGRLANAGNDSTQTNPNDSKGELTGVKESVIKKIDDNIHIYPNPTKGKIEIIFNVSYSNTTITFMDVYGREIKTIKNPKQSTINIDLSNYANGIYIIKIDNSYGEVIRKVLLQK